MNGRAGGAEKVGAAVRLPRLAVENAPRAERSVDAAWHGTSEAAVPQPARVGLRPQLLELASLLPDAGDCRIRWIHE